MTAVRIDPVFIFRGLLMAAGWALVLPCALLVLLVYFPVVPWARLLASDMVPNHTLWFALIPLAGTAIGLLAIFHRLSIPCKALIVISVATAAAALGLFFQSMRFAEMHGATINWADTLSFRDVNTAPEPDATHVFTIQQGQLLNLDVYRPDPQRWRGPAPIIVDVHGGGFVSGSRRNSAANLRWLADQGWLVFSIDYRLADANDRTWNEAQGDVACALAWVASQAPLFGGDISRLTLMGGSAGGNLALNVAYADREGRARASCPGAIPPVAAVAAYAPVVDMVGSWNNGGEMGPMSRSFLQAYIGGSPTEFPERYRQTSTATYLSPNAPPTLILAGARDAVVPPEGVRRLAVEARRAGVDVRLLLFPRANHAFNSTYDGVINQAVRQITRQFLIDHGQRPLAADHG